MVDFCMTYCPAINTKIIAVLISEVPLLSFATTDPLFAGCLVLTAVLLKIQALLNGMQYHWVSTSQCFEQSLCLHNARKHSPSDRVQHPRRLESLDLYVQQLHQYHSSQAKQYVILLSTL